MISALAQGRPNIIRAITADGVYVETSKSIREGAPPQLVPAWMIEIAWEYLHAHGELTNRYLLKDLNVKRSSAVMALLAHLPEIEVATTRPLTLRLRGIAPLAG